MKNRFKEIRVFLGNEAIGHHFSYVEFVFDNSKFQNFMMNFNGDKRVRYSRAKTEEFVFEPMDIQDFLRALRSTEINASIGVTIYDEGCLLMQDFKNRGSGTNYVKDDQGMSIEEMIQFVLKKYCDETIDANDISEECKKIIEAKVNQKKCR